MIVWVWDAGAWRGVSDSLGIAQCRVGECLDQGASLGIVRSAVVRMDRDTMQRDYVPTGCVATARKVGSGVHWSPLAIEDRAE